MHPGSCLLSPSLAQVVAGQTAALALKKIRRGAVRKGMVLVDVKNAPVACWEFDADIAILTHATTIQPRYQAVIHCEIVRQVGACLAPRSCELAYHHMARKLGWLARCWGSAEFWAAKQQLCACFEESEQHPEVLLGQLSIQWHPYSPTEGQSCLDTVEPWALLSGSYCRQHGWWR